MTLLAIILSPADAASGKRFIQARPFPGYVPTMLRQAGCLHKFLDCRVATWYLSCHNEDALTCVHSSAPMRTHDLCWTTLTVHVSSLKQAKGLAMPRSFRWVYVLILWCSLGGGFILARVVMTSTAAEQTPPIPTSTHTPTGTPVDEGTLDTLNDTKLSVDDSVYLPLIVRGNLIPSLPIPTPPVESVSFYVSSLAFDFQEIGRVRGAIDRERGNIETVVIFAFGRPETRVDPRDGTTLTGSLLPLTNTFVTTVQIRAVIEQFASGYAAGVSGNPDAFVILVVGTSNDKDNDEPDNVNASHAEQW